MATIDYALRHGSEPERIVRFPSPCPTHPDGDEARLDYLSSGWPQLCNGMHKGRCTRVWRLSVLCSGPIVQRFFCEKSLPADLRRITEPLAGTAVLVGAGADAGAAVAQAQGVRAYARLRKL